MLFAGFNVYQGNLSLVGIIVAGVVGDLIGASIAYAIAYFGLHEVLGAAGTRCTSASASSRWRMHGSSATARR